MDILDVVSAKLRSADYMVEPGQNTVWFESVTVYGLAKVYPSVDDLLGCWEDDQEAFLDAYARPIRQAGNKGWNAYTIFLSPEEVGGEQEARLFEVEEDLRATRKILRCGIRTEDDVINALYPLLPLRNVTVLSDQDILGRLKDETGIDHKLLSALHDSDDVERHLSVLLEEVL